MPSSRMALCRIWPTFGLMIILILVGTRCVSDDATTDENETVAKDDTVSTVVEGWVVIDRQARDVQIIDGIVLLSSYAPPWAQGPETGPPFLLAYDPRRQQIIWEVSRNSTAPVVACSQRIFVADGSLLAALDLGSGQTLWETTIQDDRRIQLWCDDTILLVTGEHLLSALDATQGDLLWESDVAVPLDPFVPLVTSHASWRESGALAVHGTTVYARRLDRFDAHRCQFSLVALDIDTGTQKWQFPIQQESNGECAPGTLVPAFADGLVLIVTWDSPIPQCTMVAIEASDGVAAWQRSVGDACSTASRLFSSDGHVYLGYPGGALALDAQSGQELWHRETSLPTTYYEAVADENWLVGLSGGSGKRTILLTSLTSGALVGQREVPVPEICESANDELHVGDGQFILTAGHCIRSLHTDGE